MADLEPTITLPWLVRLRWLFLAGQLAVFPIAHVGFSVQLDWWTIGVALASAAASNVVIARLYVREASSSARLMGCVLVLDTALLTLLLAASGGSMNPFTVFYLVYVTLAAVVLSLRWTTSACASGSARRSPSAACACYSPMATPRPPRSPGRSGSIAPWSTCGCRGRTASPSCSRSSSSIPRSRSSCSPDTAASRRRSRPCGSVRANYLTKPANADQILAAFDTDPEPMQETRR